MKVENVEEHRNKHLPTDHHRISVEDYSFLPPDCCWAHWDLKRTKEDGVRSQRRSFAPPKTVGELERRRREGGQGRVLTEQITKMPLYLHSFTFPFFGKQLCLFLEL